MPGPDQPSSDTKQQSSWSFQTSFSSAPRPAAKPGEDDLWMLVDYAAFAVSPDRYVFRSRRSERTEMLPINVLRALMLCNRFRSLDEHAREIQAKMPYYQSRGGELKRILGVARDRRLMVSAVDYARELRTGGNAPEPASIPRVFVRTCDRPDSLQRLFRSIRENRKAPTENPHFSVLDDSREAANNAANRRMVEEFRADAGMDVDYHGPEQQRDFMEGIARAVPEGSAALRFLLRGRDSERAVTPGRLWNYALLLAAGQRFLIMDDDMVFAAYQLPDASATFDLSGESRNPLFAPDRGAWEAMRIDGELDPLREHASFLGTTLADAIGRLSATPPAAADVSDLSAVEVKRLTARSPVLLTGNGTLGDPGTQSNAWLYTLDESFRRQFAPSDERYLENRACRNLWSGYTRPQLRTGFTLMTTTLTGVDNRRPLPPTMPALRNEDRVFGALLSAVCPGAISLEFSWALSHLPATERPWANCWDRPATLGFSGFVAEYVEQQASLCPADGIKARTSYLAQAIHALADSDDRSLTQKLRETVIRQRADLARRFQHHLDRAEGAPSQWLDDVKKTIDVNLQAIGVEDDRLVANLPGAGAAQLVEARDLLRQLAEGLRWWPALWRQAARAADREPDVQFP